MPKSVDIEDFAVKLDLVCKKLNWSRAKLAQQVGIDKSLAGRWLAGTSRPTANSLMRLNTAFAMAWPDFNATSWDLSTAELAARAGLARPGVERRPGDAAPKRKTVVDLFADLFTVQRFTEDIDLIAPRLCGFYRIWYISFTGTGNIIHAPVRILRDENALRFEIVSREPFLYEGLCFVNGNQLFVIIERQAYPGPCMCMFEGPMSKRERPFVGLIVYRPSDPGNAVIATPAVMEFVEPLGGDGSTGQQRWDELVNEAANIADGKMPAREVPSEFQSILRSSVGTPGPDSQSSHVLRISRVT